MSLRKRSLFEISTDEMVAYNTLVGLSQRMDEANANLEAEDGGINPEAVEQLEVAQREFARTADALLSKVEAVADFILDMDMCVEAAESEIDRVTARKKRFDGAARRMREYVLRVMEMRDQDKIVCNTCELVRRLNPESVEITQPHLIPDDMKRVPPPPALVPDKAKIKEAIKSGHHVEGARLTRTARLVIQ